MNKTSIEWTDFTANPLKFRAPDGRVVWACEKVSPGCTNCYAEHLSTRYGGTRRAGDWNAGTMATLTPFLDPDEIRKMLTAKTVGGKAVSGAKVFVGDMTDIFGSWVPNELLDRLFAVFALRPDVTFQVLTKRADRMREYFAAKYDASGCLNETALASIASAACEVSGSPCAANVIEDCAWPLPNVWLGVSVEDQTRANERIPLLLETPAAVRFISAEPLLGPVDLNALPDPKGDPSWDASAVHGMRECAFGATVSREKIPALDWVIVGGESGYGARPFNVAWARSIVRQCKAAGVAVFVKQLGKNVLDRNDAGFDGCSPTSWPEEIEQRDAVEDNPHGFREEWQGAEVRVRLRDSHGGDPSEWPADLRVREFPKGAA